MDASAVTTNAFTYIQMVYDILKYLVGIGTACGAIYAFVMKPIRKHQKSLEDKFTQIQDSINRVTEQLVILKDDNADILQDRLQQAHDYYIKQGWCSQARKEQLIRMHERYRGLGRNHLADHNEQDILDLPDFPIDN